MEDWERVAISMEIILFSEEKTELEKDTPFQGSHMLSSQKGILNPENSEEISLFSPLGWEVECEASPTEKGSFLTIPFFFLKTTVPLEMANSSTYTLNPNDRYMFLQNTGFYLQDCTMSQPARLQSDQSVT